MISAQQQRGLSLIELMLGILLSSLIIGAVLAIFSGARSSSLLIDAESKMLDEAQFAMESINSVIRMAGYTMNPKAGENSNLAVLKLNDVLLGTEGGSEASDRIEVWYEGNEDGSVFDCHGNTITTNTDDGNGMVVGNQYLVDEENSLVCSRILEDGNPATDVTRPIIDNVAKLDILFGVDTDADGIVNQYRLYNKLTVGDRLKVVAVMIELTLETQVTGDVLSKKFTSAVQLRNRSL